MDGSYVVEQKKKVKYFSNIFGIAKNHVLKKVSDNIASKGRLPTSYVLETNYNNSCGLHL